MSPSPSSAPAPAGQPGVEPPGVEPPGSEPPGAEPPGSEPPGAERSGTQQDGAAPGTKERLLDAAETLFAERGFAGTSVRDVTRSAGVSVSAANYHFGSKEALLLAALQRRIEPANARRELLLEAAVSRGAVLEEVLEAFFRPVLELQAAALSRGRARQSRQLSVLLYANPPAFAEQLRRDLFGEITLRFEAALASALPDAGEESIEVLAQLAIGALVHLLRGEVGSEGSRPDVEAQLALLVRFSAGGIRQAAARPDRGRGEQGGRGRPGRAS